MPSDRQNAATRRALLAGAAVGLTGLSGCMSLADGGTSTPTESQTPSPTRTRTQSATDPGLPVEGEDPVRQQAQIKLPSGAYAEPLGPYLAPSITAVSHDGTEEKIEASDGSAWFILLMRCRGQAPAPDTDKWFMRSFVPNEETSPRRSHQAETGDLKYIGWDGVRRPQHAYKANYSARWQGGYLAWEIPQGTTRADVSLGNDFWESPAVWRFHYDE